MHKDFGYGAMILSHARIVQCDKAESKGCYDPREYWAPWCEIAHVNLTDDVFDSALFIKSILI